MDLDKIALELALLLTWDSHAEVANEKLKCINRLESRLH